MIKKEYMYVNSIVEFWRTKNRYKIVSMNSKMKHPETGEWIVAVIYTTHSILTDGEYVEVEEENQQIYVREKTDFLQKFNLSMGL